ncbi:MAG: DUF5906 domain-containing protein [Candidatus Binataceae bacterium]
MLDRDFSSDGQVGGNNSVVPTKRGGFILPGDDPAAEMRAATTGTVEHLGKSGVAIEDFPAGDIKPVTPAMAEERGYPAVGGYIMSFRGRDSELTGFERLRNPTNPKYPKDIQKKGSGAHIYFPVIDGIDWQDLEAGATVAIAESIIKAIAVLKHRPGRPVVGMTGCWGFRSKKSGQYHIADDLKALPWKKRKLKALIVLDSNAWTNPDVIVAQNTLAYELSALGAEVQLLKLLNAADGQHQGVDDFIINGGKMNDLEVVEIPSLQELGAVNKTFCYISEPAGVYEFESGILHDRGEWTHGLMANRDMQIQFIDRRKKKEDRVPEYKTIPIAPAWIGWPNRRSYKKWEFAPGQEESLPNGNLNLWPGWGCDSVQGDVSHFYRLLDHVFKNDRHRMLQFLAWLAYPIKHPGAKLDQAWVVYGEPWSGKTLLAGVVKGIYGKAWRLVSHGMLHTPHNEWQRGCQFAFLDEAFSIADDRRAEYNTMKLRITSKEVEINSKHVKQYTLPDHSNYFIASNDSNAVYFDRDDRRYEVHKITSGRIDHNLGVEIGTRYESPEGAAALRYHFEYDLDWLLKDYDPKGDSHGSPGRKEMLYASGSNVDNIIADMIEEQRETAGADGGKAIGSWNLIRFDQLKAKIEERTDALKLPADKVITNALERTGAMKFGRVSFQVQGFQNKEQVWIIDNQAHWLEKDADTVRSGVAEEELRRITALPARLRPRRTHGPWRSRSASMKRRALGMPKPRRRCWNGRCSPRCAGST